MSALAIEITLPGTCITDQLTARVLATRCPRSFRAFQDVLVATSKMLKGAGWFSSKRSRVQKLQRLCYDLDSSLRAEDFQSDKGSTERVFSWFNEFSKAFAKLATGV